MSNEIKANNPGLDDARHAEPARSDTPQVRTLLLTDLVDSTTLVERLGDGPAAELFRAHDRLVLELQQRWRGRLIDRSDGLLLLFERPVDALGFALDYNRGLRVLGKRPELQQRQIVLQARAGLHVGEVLTWRNSEAAVQAGAKPLEVEGIAKPLAGRLMMLARPGQILLSATAEPMARRSARELGERSEHLIWKSHGRWRLKGVPDVQEIFEVGEPGFAPLRAPRQNHAKAWRDIPLWRRPAALAAEVLLLVGIGTGIWFITKPQPAIAFGERDWVVVGDLRNLTGDKRFDDALEAALRISLEQSRYVNVIPDMRVRDTLQLMQRDPTTARVDRDVGSEVAVRSGARALLLPTVAEVGGQVQVSVEVIDPATQATVYAESAAGNGGDSAIQSAGVVSTALREQLGEALSSIQASSAPVEKVTTANLDALRAFTLGQEAYARQKLVEADQHFRQALAIDPQFAMARIGLARIAFAKMDASTALREMEASLADAARLTGRERLYATAQLALIRWDRDFLDKWIALSKLYPDFHVAAFNVSTGMRYANRFPEMLTYSRRAAAPQAITRPFALHHMGLSKLAMGRLRDAERDFRQSTAVGVSGGFVEPAFVLAAKRRFSEAQALLKPGGGPPQAMVERRMAEITLLADAGHWQEAGRKARVLDASMREPAMPFEWAARTVTLAVMRRTATESDVRRASKRLLDQAEPAMPTAVGRARESVVNAMLYAGYAAVAAGDPATAQRALQSTRSIIAQAPQPVLANLAAIVQARLQLRAGNAQVALDLLKPYDRSSALLLTRLVVADAQHMLGQNVDLKPGTQATPKWRGRAYAEWAAERPPVIEALAPR